MQMFMLSETFYSMVLVSDKNLLASLLRQRHIYHRLMSYLNVNKTPFQSSAYITMAIFTVGFYVKCISLFDLNISFDIYLCVF